MIKKIINQSPTDKEFLEKTTYESSICDIDFKDILVKKPWGAEYLLFENDFCAIWILNINYMQHTSMHCHVEKSTSLICLDGEVSCSTLENNNILKPLDGIHFNKKIFHQTQSIWKNGSHVLEIETPVNKFDLVRINDNYGRCGKEYEDNQHYDTVKNLTLEFPNNTIKHINETTIEIIKPSTLDFLNNYQDDTIIFILDECENIGEIMLLTDIKERTILIDKTLLIIRRG